MHERRGFLASAGALGLAGLAGCTGLLEDDSSSADDEGDDDEGGGLPPYAEWVYAPSTLSAESTGQFSVQSPSALVASESSLDGDFYAQVTADFSGVGIENADAERFINITGDAFGQVLTGSFDTETVGDALVSNRDLSEAGSYQDFTLYRPPDTDSQLFAVSENRLLFGTPSGADVTARAIIEALVAAHAGDGERFVEASDSMDDMVGACGNGTFVDGQTFEERTASSPSDGRFEGSVGDLRTVSLEGESAAVTHAVAFASADAVAVDAVEEWATDVESGGAWQDCEDVTVRQQGSLAVATGVVATGDLRRAHVSR